MSWHPPTERRMPRSRGLDSELASSWSGLNFLARIPARAFRDGGRTGEEIHDLGQTCDRGLREQMSHRRVDVESRADGHDDLSGCERVTAEIEEIVVDAGRARFPARRPRSRRSGTRSVFAERRAASPGHRFRIGSRQRLPVDLAARRERDAPDADEVRRAPCIRAAFPAARTAAPRTSPEGRPTTR